VYFDTIYIVINVVFSLIVSPSLCLVFFFLPLLGNQSDFASPTAQTVPLLAVQFIAYYLINDVTSARMLWKRLSPGLKQSQELQAAWNIGQALWKSEREQVFVDINKFDWSPAVVPFISVLTDTLRQRHAELIERAYSSLNLNTCAAMLGLDSDATAQCMMNIERAGAGAGDGALAGSEDVGSLIGLDWIVHVC
jgi:CSN8/PSMD8/EIF3K family